MARAVQLASDLSQVGLAHHRPPHLWKLRRLGAMAPEGLRTRISHVSSPEGPPLKIIPEGQNRQITEDHGHRTRQVCKNIFSLAYHFFIHISGFSSVSDS